MSQKTYYLFNPGRMSRKDNTLRFDPVSEENIPANPRYIPIEGVSDLYIFGSLDANSELYNFLGKHQIAVHFFDYYEHYRGSFMPKDYLLAGKAQIEQTRTYTNKRRRLYLARQLVHGASYNMLRNLKYYQARGKDLELIIANIESLIDFTNKIDDISTLMGYEGNMRKSYYQAFGRDSLQLGDFRKNQTATQRSGECLDLIWEYDVLYALSWADLPYTTQSNH